MIPRSGLFNPEQLAEIYCCTRDALEDSALTIDRENLLREIGEKVRDYVPNLGELIQQPEEQKPNQGLEASW